MQRDFWIGLSAGLGIAAIIGATTLLADRSALAQDTSRAQNFKENEAGTIPKDWGDLITVTGTKGNMILVFKSTEDGTLRFGDLAGHIGANCTIVRRN